MLRHFFLYLLLVLSAAVGAQELEVVSFEQAVTDNSAFTQPRMDLNNRYCAIVKVRFIEEKGTFEGKVFEEPLFKTNEYWVYMTEGAKHLGCRFPGFDYLDVVFSDHSDIKALKQKSVYILTLKGERKSGLESVEQGDPESMMRMARNYEQGIGSYAKDLAHALHWYRQAAEAGSEAAQDYLADVLYQGKNGYKRDYYEAFRWHKACAERGRIDSFYPLGVMLAKGLGTEEAPDQAVEWLRKYNAERNHPRAQLLLANLLGTGTDEGLSLMKRAADNGVVEAMRKYAEAVEQTDPEASRLYYHKAAQGEQADAGDKPKAEATAPADDYPWLSERAVTEEDLKGKSHKELRIMRSTILARHGQIFTDQTLMRHFMQFSWYQPVPFSVTGQLTRLEKENIDFIRAHE